MRATATITFLASFALLIVFFAGGWHFLSQGSGNPLPWAIQSAWGNLIGVGQGVEALIGYTPRQGREVTHQVIVVGAAALFWAIIATCIVSVGLGIRRTLFRRRSD